MATRATASSNILPQVRHQPEPRRDNMEELATALTDERYSLELLSHATDYRVQLHENFGRLAQVIRELPPLHSRLVSRFGCSLLVSRELKVARWLAWSSGRRTVYKIGNDPSGGPPTVRIHIRLHHSRNRMAPPFQPRQKNARGIAFPAISLNITTDCT